MEKYFTSEIRHPSGTMFDGEQSLSEPDLFVSLTYDALDTKAQMDRVKSPKAGAVVLFAGTGARPVAHVQSMPFTHSAYR